MTLRVACVLALLLSACRPSPGPAPAASEERAPPASSAAPEVAGLEPVDVGADPCDNFYQYACGRWLATHPRPPEAPAWARSFSVADAAVQKRLRGLLDELATASDPRHAALGKFWRTCKDEPARAAAGLGAIEPLLTAIDAAKPSGLAGVLGALHAHGVHALFRPRHRAAAKALAIGLGSTGLGPASMYAPSSPRLAPYRQHVGEMLRLANLGEVKDPAALARRVDAVIALETRLAELQPTVEELIAAEREPPAPRPLAQVRREARSFDWSSYFAALGQPAPSHLVVPAGRFGRLVALVQATDVAVLRDYLRWQLLHFTAQILPPVLGAEHNRMYDPEAAVGGLEAGCVQQVETAFGPALGQAYVERHVAPADRTRLRGLVERLRGVLRREVEGASWIDASAREKVLAFVDSLKIEIAEPPPAVDPPSVTDDFLATSLALRKAKIAAVREGTAPSSPPATSVNGRMGEGTITLFAGIVQPPFYSPDLPEPVLLGAIGQIVAHELGHVLDPESWVAELGVTPTPDTTAAYEARVQCVRDSYARAEIAPGVRVNGDFVAKESFADNLGLRLAHALAREGGPEAERRFFVAWGQLMCTDFMPEALAMMAGADVAPAPLRVNQPLALFPPFAAAFACTEGTPMRPRDACSPW